MKAKTPAIRDRIVGFKRVKASQLVANKNNWRVHSEAQRSVLRDLLSEVGIADALICRQLPKGKLEVIDGHLRQDTDPNIEWPVLILDVTAEEATKLMLSMDPLSAMATADLQKLDALREAIKTQSANLTQMWESSRMAALLMMESSETPNEVDWNGMPEFEQDGDPAYQTVIVHFKNRKDVEEFSRLINQTLTEKTKTIWHPYQAPEKVNTFKT